LFNVLITGGLSIKKIVLIKQLSSRSFLMWSYCCLTYPTVCPIGASTAMIWAQQSRQAKQGWLHLNSRLNLMTSFKIMQTTWLHFLN